MAKHLLQKENKEKKKSLKLNFKRSISEEDFTEKQKAKHTAQGNGILTLVLAAVLIIAIPFLPLEGWMLKSAYAVGLLLAALELIWSVMDNIQAKHYLAADNILLLCALISFGIGYELEAVLILVLFRISSLILKFIDKKCFEKSRIFSSGMPQSVCVESLEGPLRVEPYCINKGDIILIEAGETIALDGIIVEGISTIDTCTVSGQSNPWAVNEGYRVFAGCRNISSPIKVKVSRQAQHSTIQRLINLSQDSLEYKSRQEKFADLILKYYIPGLIAAGFTLFLALSAVNGQWLANAGRGLVLLSAASSAISLRTVHLVYVKSLGNAVQSGIFAKGCDCIESMAKAETMVFDKTGIITEGRFIISDVFPNKVTEHELLSIAATAERFSRHPIAAALKEAAGSIDIDSRALQIEEIPGRGISAFVGDKQVYVGNTALLEEHGIKCAIPTRSGSAIHVAVDQKYWGHILVTDRIRRGAFDALENLRATGVKKTVLLTGDVLSVAKPLASKLNFDMLRAELKPYEKINAVDFLMANRGEATTLAFVGNASSDKEIMSRVDVGISMGALGSDTAFASADVLIMDRDIKKLPFAIKLSKLCYRVCTECIAAWMLLNILTVILGALGVLPLIAAIIIQFLLTCFMIINTLRIK